MKNDLTPKNILSNGVYDATPKSTFALIAIYLAERIDGGETGALSVLQEEVKALQTNGIVTKSQARALLKAVR